MEFFRGRTGLLIVAAAVALPSSVAAPLPLRGRNSAEAEVSR